MTLSSLITAQNIGRFDAVWDLAIWIMLTSVLLAQDMLMDNTINLSHTAIGMLHTTYWSCQLPKVPPLLKNSPKRKNCLSFCKGWHYCLNFKHILALGMLYELNTCWLPLITCCSIAVTFIVGAINKCDACLSNQWSSLKPCCNVLLLQNYNTLSV